MKKIEDIVKIAEAITSDGISLIITPKTKLNNSDMLYIMKWATKNYNKISDLKVCRYEE